MEKRTVVLYAAINESGEWLHLDKDLIGTQLFVERHPETHVERWEYPVDRLGLFGVPVKSRYNKQRSWY